MIGPRPWSIRNRAEGLWAEGEEAEVVVAEGEEQEVHPRP